MYAKKYILFIVLLLIFSSCGSNDSSNEEVSPKEDKRVQAALAPGDCPPLKETTYPDHFYAGPIIDTHVHIGNIPNSKIIQEEGKNSIKPVAGENFVVDNIICMLDHGATKQAFIFFPVWEPTIEESLNLWEQMMLRHEGRIIPFIMPPDNDNDSDGFPTVDAEALQKMTSINPGLFVGYGEIGLYARGNDGAPELPPDSERLLNIYPIIIEENLLVYFHLGVGHEKAFEYVAQKFPQITFIFHGDQLVSYGEAGQDLSTIGGLLERNPNIYYGVDELYGDVNLIRPDVTKEEFMAHFENREELLEIDWGTWKGFIEKYPDQVFWGTDRGPNELWSMDPEVSVLLTEYAREFIGGLDPTVQEKFAYKNVEKLIKDR